MAVVIDHEFKASPDALWEILGTPDRVDWVPGVTSCSFDGEVRSLDLPGAGTIKERILTHDNDARILEYSCFESPMYPWAEGTRPWAHAQAHKLLSNFTSATFCESNLISSAIRYKLAEPS